MSFKANLALNEQRQNIEKLLKNSHKSEQIIDEIDINQKPPISEKKIQSISPGYTTGSTAASGSSDFHILKAARRRMYDSEEKERELEKHEKEAIDFQRKRLEHMKRDEAKTEKNRKRRKKRKTGHTSGLSYGSNERPIDVENIEDGPTKKSRSESTLSMSKDGSSQQTSESENHKDDESRIVTSDSSNGVLNSSSKSEKKSTILIVDEPDF